MATTNPTQAPTTITTTAKGDATTHLTQEQAKAEAAESQSFVIYIKALTGKTATVDCTLASTVQEVLFKMQDKWGVTNFRLIFRNAELDEGRKLVDYGVQKESTLHIMPKRGFSGVIRY